MLDWLIAGLQIQLIIYPHLQKLYMKCHRGKLVFIKLLVLASKWNKLSGTAKVKNKIFPSELLFFYPAANVKLNA